MTEFLKLLAPDAARNLILERIMPNLTAEIVDTENAYGLVTAEKITAPHSLPNFRRSTVDGYAVKAQDTFGASTSLPAYLKLVGEVLMGQETELEISPAECAKIHTGGMLPVGTSAVVMVEDTQRLNSNEVEIYKPSAVGENIIEIGEDIKSGEILISRNKKIREAEIGGLLAFGITKLSVLKKPIVGLLSTGDEIVSPEMDISPGQVRDINSHTLSVLIAKYGGIPVRHGIVPDQIDRFMEETEKAFRESDMLIITAGSSVSARDYTARVINSLGPPGILVHGINIRPGKPTILAICDGKPVIGLPGNPVSALVITKLFVHPVLQKLLGLSEPGLNPSIEAELSINIPSRAGREDWIPVRVLIDSKGLKAEPVFGKSNLIFTLVKSNGLVKIPVDSNGIDAGEIVEVIPL
jgi:molybdopterin molybdotransferase